MLSRVARIVLINCLYVYSVGLSVFYASAIPDWQTGGIMFWGCPIFVRPSMRHVRPSVTRLVNAILWTRMNWFWCIIGSSGRACNDEPCPWASEGQRSHESEDEFQCLADGGTSFSALLGRVSFSALLGRVAFLVFLLFLRYYFVCHFRAYRVRDKLETRYQRHQLQHDITAPT